MYQVLSLRWQYSNTNTNATHNVPVKLPKCCETIVEPHHPRNESTNQPNMEPLLGKAFIVSVDKF